MCPASSEGGRLFVRGPNVMIGYYRADNPGELEPPAGGWHDTGDIVTIDAEGFVAIKGRAKRFVKIAGELVSLAAIEDLCRACGPTTSSPRRRARPEAGRTGHPRHTHTGATKAEVRPG